MENILVIRFKSIGDVLFTLPAVHAVREQFPDARITFLTSRENAGLVKGFREVDEVIPLDRAGLRAANPMRILSGVASLLGTLRREPFSKVFDFQGYGETELLSWWTGAPERWGVFDRPTRGWTCTGICGRPLDVHPAEADLMLLRRAGLAVGAVRNEYTLPAEDLARARQFFAAQYLDERPSTLFLQPFTSSPGKNWPLEKYLEVARHWRAKGWQILFGGGPAERVALEPARAAGFVVAAGVPLSVCAGLMALSTLVVGGDTGVVHLAVAMRKRVVMLMRINEPGCCHPFQHPDWGITPPTPKSITLLETPTVIAALQRAQAERGIA